MQTARRRPDFEVLVDDLFLRLRWVPPTTPSASRSYPLYGLTDEPLLLSYFREAKVWWLSNELSQLDDESRRWLLYELYQRPPKESALLTLSLLGAVPFPELRLEDIDVMASWFECEPLPSRNVRDALVLRIWLRWLVLQPESVVGDKVQEWLRSHPCLVRAALVLSVGLASESADRYHASLRQVFDSLTSVLGRGEREVGSAVGWFVSSIWRREPELAERWLVANAHRLSRRVYRIAAGRMPSPVRLRLMARWKAARLTHSGQQR